MNIIILRKKQLNLIDMERGKKFILPLPLYSIKNISGLRKRPVVTGYVGARGSGKSVGATRSVCLDYLLRGYNVWSNMWIGFQLLTPGGLELRETKPFDKIDLDNLDEIYNNGAIVWDEPNIEIAEARRSQANSNLKASYLVQQIRKRRLDIVWMAQSEMHVDNRLRAQTDLFVQCKDASTVPTFNHWGMGVQSQWRLFDTSGLVKGEAPSSGEAALFDTRTIYNEPWWNCYDTYELQGISDGEEQESGPSTEILELTDSAIAVFEREGGFEVPPYVIWQAIGVIRHGQKILVGQELSNRGIHKNYKGWYTREPVYESIEDKV